MLAQLTSGGKDGKGMASHYKMINFDTLKERHDNFSFEKAIETKGKVYDTLHFQGLF